MDGVGICAENYTRWINEDHGEAYIFVPSTGDNEDRDTLSVIRTPSIPFALMKPYRLGMPWLSRKVTGLLKTLPFTIVHSHTPFIAGRTARRVAKQHCIPHVTTFHTKYRDDISRIVGGASIVDPIVSQIVAFYDTVDMVTVPNEATAATLHSYGYAGDTQVIPNGTDLDAVAPESRQQFARRGEELAGVAPGEFVFLFVGQHRWEKNVRLVIEALGRLNATLRGDASDTRRPFAALFVGEGKDSADMHELVDSVGLSREAVCLGKIVDREAMKCIYARSNLFLFPSLYDTSGLVMQEAAAFGVPSVAARGASAAEVIRDGENGFITDNDPDDLEALLRSIIGRPDQIERVGQEAQRTVHRSWRDSVRIAVDLYWQLIKEKRAGTGSS